MFRPLVDIKNALKGRNFEVAKEPGLGVTLTSSKPSYAAYSIGEWTYGEPLIKSWDQNSTLTVGKFCSIAEGVTIMLGGEHRSDWVTTYPFAEVVFQESELKMGHSKGDVNIGNDVWICLNALILSGVNVGNGAIIGAGAVVTKDVPPYAIVGGNPARLIRYRIPESLIPAMEGIRWWDWPLHKLEEALPLLLSPDIKGFVDNYQV